jgi:hypothetical protein
MAKHDSARAIATGAVFTTESPALLERGGSPDTEDLEVWLVEELKAVVAHHEGLADALGGIARVPRARERTARRRGTARLASSGMNDHNEDDYEIAGEVWLQDVAGNELCAREPSRLRLTRTEGTMFDHKFVTAHQLRNSESDTFAWLRFDDEDGKTIIQLFQGKQDAVMVLPTGWDPRPEGTRSGRT